MAFLRQPGCFAAILMPLMLAAFATPPRLRCHFRRSPSLPYADFHLFAVIFTLDVDKGTRYQTELFDTNSIIRCVSFRHFRRHAERDAISTPPFTLFHDFADIFLHAGSAVIR